MKFIAPKKALLDALSKVVPVTDRKSTLPILANALFDAEPGAGVRISATDLYQGISCSLDIPVNAIGRVALPAKDLLDRIRVMPDGDVEISVGDDCQATVKSVGSARRCVISGLPAVDFPDLPRPHAEAPRYSWTVGDLRSLLAKVDFAMSTDHTRTNIHGLLMEVLGDRIRLVATDSHRMAVAEMPWQHATAATVLLPFKAATDLARLLDRDGLADTVEMVVSGAHAFFYAAAVEFSTKLADAQFPPWQQVLPQRSEYVAPVSRAAFIDAARTAATAADPKNNGVRFEFCEGMVVVSAKSAANGEASDTIDTSSSAAKGFFHVNFKYAIEAAESFDDDEIRVEFSDALSQIVLRTDRGGATQVVMPVRLD